MKIVVFGLTVSSSWGNGHATLWRGLIKALARRGHDVTFFEKDVPYYSSQRDVWELTKANLILYREWDDIAFEAHREINSADVAMITSYCPDSLVATDRVLDSHAKLKAFYDMDTPITLTALSEGVPVPYLGPNGLRGFDIVFSYTGGSALQRLRTDLHAERVAPLYGSVDPDMYHRVAVDERFQCDLSYLGTFSQDRQNVVRELFLEPARLLPHKKFLIGGAKYPDEFPWDENIYFARHVAPLEHPAFYSSSTLTLNATRKAMAEMGYCPSGRLFEAAACGTPIISDAWEGMNHFFTPGHEIIVAETSEDSINAMSLPEEELQRIGERARARTLDEHTADKRVQDLERELDNVLMHVQSNEVAVAG